MTTKVPNSMLESPATGGAVAQVKSASTSAASTAATTMPFDETIPQQTEGNEVLTVAITPTSASNYLEVEAVLQISTNSTTNYLSAALFRDSTAGAIAANAVYASNAKYPYQIVVRARVLAGSTTATTFKLRAGGSSDSIRINKTFSDGQLFGGVAVTKLTVTEVSP